MEGDSSEGFIQWLKNPRMLAVGIFLSTLLMKLAKYHYKQVAERTGLRVTSIVKTTIHKKALSLAAFERQKFPDEYIRNLILTESHQFKAFVQFLPFLVVAPVNMAFGAWIILQELGKAAFGMLIAVIVIAIICLIYLPVPDTEPEEDDDPQQDKEDDRKTELDKRVQWEKDLISGLYLYLYLVADKGIQLSIVSGIYAVKCHGWEQTVERQIPSIRSNRLTVLLMYGRHMLLCQITIQLCLVARGRCVRVVTVSLMQGFYWITIALVFLLSSLVTNDSKISQWFTCQALLGAFASVANEMYEMVTCIKRVRVCLGKLSPTSFSRSERWLALSKIS